MNGAAVFTLATLLLISGFCLGVFLAEPLGRFFDATD